MNLLEALFGRGDHLSPLQMGVRALLTFFVALALVRVAGMRTFGRGSAFDRIVGIMLGAVLARGVVGASPYGATVVASAVIVVVHRVLAHVCLKHAGLERLLKGEHRLLYRDGVVDEHAMTRSGISRSDLLEGVRQSANVDSIEGIAAAYIESNGQITAVKKNQERSAAATDPDDAA
jgi:uncharacterized membrane protein YcaP (DUF421 family)